MKRNSSEGRNLMPKIEDNKMVGQSSIPIFEEDHVMKMLGMYLEIDSLKAQLVNIPHSSVQNKL